MTTASPISLFSFLLLLLASSCASIVSKSEYDVRIDSNPSGAHIEVTNLAGDFVYEGETPTILSLPSGQGYFSAETYSIAAELPGYRDSQTQLRADFDAWYMGNLVFGGVIGLLIVDPLTGAMWKFKDQLRIEMEPEAPALPESQEALVLVTN